MAEAIGYPARWETDVALSDGGVVHVRPIRPDDRERLAAFHERQSAESIYYRFFSPRPKLNRRELDRFTQVDYVDRMAFVALLGEELIGLATYDRRRNQAEAEVSFIVDDDQQGRGLATVLLEYLIVAAREVGLTSLTATVLPDNRRMLGVFHSVGFETSTHFASGVVEVVLGLERTEVAEAAIEGRAQRGEGRSVERLLSPESVAVIGAGRERTSLGHAIFRGLLAHGFAGAVYPINSSAQPVASVRSYPSVLDVPDDVDLAVVAVPAYTVLEVVEECGRKGVAGLVVVSAGFDGFWPYGEAGASLIVERARRYGMRVIGPESLGIINTAPTRSMHATFTDVEVRPGRVGFLTQSGTLGAAALEHARRVGVGISTFIDAGAKVDVSGNDLLQYWESDPRTSVVALYLDSFGNPRRFTRIARRLARHKPIIAVKSRGPWAPEDIPADAGEEGRWPIDATVSAMLAQSGVIRVDTPVEMFDLARLLVDQPVPAGHRVAVLSNSSGATTLTVDACRGAGLELAVLEDRTRALLSVGRPATVPVTNPVDLTFAAAPEDYERGLAALLADPGVDCVVVIYAPSFPRRTEEVARAVGAAASAAVVSEQGSSQPIVGIVLGSDIGRPLAEASVRVPLYAFPSEAVRALGAAAAYGDWLRRPEGTFPDVDVVPEAGLAEARSAVAEALGKEGGSGWLSSDRATALLGSLGFPLVAHRPAHDAPEAAAAAAELGFPVVLKARDLARLWPGEDGGVALSLYRPDDVASAYRRMAERFGDHMHPAQVQRMVDGPQVLVAGHQHANFGGVISVGRGGPAASAEEVLPLRILPLADTDARDLVAHGRLGEGLDEHGRQLVEDLVLRLAVVMEQVPELADVVLNPVIIGAGRAAGAGGIADARIRLAPYRYDPTPAVRRL